MTAPSGRAGRPLRSAAVLNGTHRLPTQLARAHGMAAITATGTSNTDSSASLDVQSFPATTRSRPVLRPLLTSARSARASRCGPSARRQRQHNRHPGRHPRIRTTNFPLRPPRLRDDPVDGDGLHLLEQAHPDRPASYAVRVPRCRDTPRASFPPRLTTTQLPPGSELAPPLPPGDFHPQSIAHAGRTEGWRLRHRLGDAPSGALLTVILRGESMPGTRRTAWVKPCKRGPRRLGLRFGLEPGEAGGPEPVDELLAPLTSLVA